MDVAVQSSVVQTSGRQEQQPPVDEDAAPQLQTIVALKGQLLHWRLLVANSGSTNHHILAQLCLR